MKTFHHADVKTSARLQAVYNFVRARGSEGATSMEIVRWASVVNPSGAASEINASLRDHGIPEEIVGEEVEGTESGRRIWRFTWKKKGELFCQPED